MRLLQQNWYSGHIVSAGPVMGNIQFKIDNTKRTNYSRVIGPNNICEDAILTPSQYVHTPVIALNGT